MNRGRKADMNKRTETMNILEKEYGVGSVVSRKQIVDALEKSGIAYRELLSRIVFIITDDNRKVAKNQYKLGMNLSQSTETVEISNKDDFEQRKANLQLTKEEIEKMENIGQRLNYLRKLKKFNEQQNEQKVA